MKTNILFLSALISANCLSAQVNETVSMTAGYANDNYYTLEDGNEVSIARDNWDLAFASNSLGGASSTVRINGGMGTNCWLYNNDITQWASLDTTNFNWSANQLVNSDASWTTGAFENTTPASAFDLGWGTYSLVTHTVEGDKIFILKLANGAYKKLIINSLISGVFSFQYADLNGANPVTSSLTKSDYLDKNFGYYSLQNDQTIDRDPLSDSWDILFTKYVTDLGGGTYYPVTGVLANRGVSVAQVNNVGNVNTVSYSNQSFDSTNISVLGYDWKSYSFGSGSYVITDSLVYFVGTTSGDVFKIIFTAFGGSANGDFIFTKEKVYTVSVAEAKEKTKILDVYPNPASENLNITFAGGAEQTLLSIYDVSGKEVFQKQINNIGLNQENIDVSNLDKGIYILMLTTENSNSSKKIIIQ